MKQRAYDNVDSATLDAYGGGEEFPLYFGDFADNGNYLETNEIAERHGVCGDPEQVRTSVSWFVMGETETLLLLCIRLNLLFGIYCCDSEAPFLRRERDCMVDACGTLDFTAFF